MLAFLSPSRSRTVQVSRWMHTVLLAVAGSLLLALCAKLSIDIGPVPVSAQTFVTLALSMAVGARSAGLMLALYLTYGLLGFPVFAGTPEKGLGLAYMAGPTGGYLAGFLLAAVLVGWLADRGWSRRFITTIAAALAGHAVIFTCGVLWLHYFLPGWSATVAAGVTPFLGGLAVKTVAVGLVVPTLRRWL